MMQSSPWSGDFRDLVGKWWHMSVTLDFHTLLPYPSVNSIGPNWCSWWIVYLGFLEFVWSWILVQTALSICGNYVRVYYLFGRTLHPVIIQFSHLNLIRVGLYEVFNCQFQIGSSCSKVFLNLSFVDPSILFLATSRGVQCVKKLRI